MGDAVTSGDLRLPTHGDVERGSPFTIEIDGSPVRVYPGETVVGAIMARGIGVCRVTARGRRTRGLYCGIGFCYDCLMVIDGRPNRRACMTYVAPGMRVRTQDGWGEPPPPSPERP